MKGNSDLLVDALQNSYSLDNGLQSNSTLEEILLNISPEVKPQRIKDNSFLYQLWKRLVFWPQSFSQSPNTPISTILNEDIDSVASDSIRAVLSNTLELPLSSQELSKAYEDSIKIFHEDYPGDFILEYKGERLGIMLLDKCIDSTGEAQLHYRFNPKIKSFRGLF